MSTAERGAAPQKLGPSRGIVYRLTALFSVDAFGGGFLVQTILALWLFRTFDLSVETAASIFFWSNLLIAVSYLIAVPIARRIGLINTMVFTHLPSNLCLIAIPFIGNLHDGHRLLMIRSLAVANGRADADLLRHGGRDAAGTRRPRRA